MKQKTGFILALASAAPAVAGDAVPEARIVPNEAANVGVAATANAQGVAAALDEGRALLMAGNAAQAISAFRLALTADQSSISALNGLGIAYDRLGRRDLARRHFEMALAVDPDAADIAYNLGLSLHLAGEDRAAVPWLQRAAGGDDGRAATAARRVLAQIAARLEAQAAGPVIAPPAASSAEAPMRVASARIDMASNGEAVLVLPSSVAHPMARAPVLAKAKAPLAAPVLALSVPVDRVINASLPDARVDVSTLAVDLPVIADASADASSRAAAAPPVLLPVRDVMASRLGALAALTIPMVVPAAPAPAFAPPPLITAEAPAAGVDAPAAAPSARLFQASVVEVERAPLPRVITLGDTPPDFGDLEPLPAPVVSAVAPPLRLLDLAALPLLATATPMQPLPLLAPARLAVDWLAGTDIEAIAPGDEPPAYARLVDALLAQADLADAVDPQAVRLAISRLESLVARIRLLTSEIANA